MSLLQIEALVSWMTFLEDVYLTERSSALKILIHCQFVLFNWTNRESVPNISGCLKMRSTHVRLDPTESRVI